MTKRTPKSLILIKRKPFLEYVIEFLKDQGFKNYMFLTGYMGSKIKKYFSNGRHWDIKIRYSQERLPLGTAGALKKAKDLLDQEFLLLYGDSILKINYLSLINDFKKNRSLLELAIYKDQKKLTYVPSNICWNKKTHKILTYSKANHSRCDYVDAGAMVVSKKIISLFPDQTISLENEIFPILIKKGMLRGFKVPVPFYDIGTPERLQSFRKIAE
ncbi:MAG: hypothetical protein HYT97_00630 [Elusimicrobia bacterium]|nr:hypothetical protein [Elusimicrobiota bacterium]